MIQSLTDARTRRPAPHAAPLTQPSNSIRALQTFGQSVWLDYLRRSLFTSGEFGRLIVEDGLRGATSNPSIFEKAIAGSTDYLDALHGIERHGDMEPMALYEDSLPATLAHRLSQAVTPWSTKLYISAAVFSWGDAAHEALPASRQ